MFKEWKAIFKKPTFIIVMVGISLIPALYNIISYHQCGIHMVNFRSYL